MSSSAQPPDWGAIVQEWARGFANLMSQVLATIDTAVVDVARAAYVTILLIGFILYFTHVERRLGKDLIKGGFVLAVLSELVFPFLVKV